MIPRRTASQALRVRDLTPQEKLSLSAAWWPPRGDTPRIQIRWRSWSEFLGTWERVRTEYLRVLCDETGVHLRTAQEPFAELVYRYVRRHGLANLEAAIPGGIQSVLKASGGEGVVADPKPASPA